jgi:hypothetical protein
VVVAVWVRSVQAARPLGLDNISVLILPLLPVQASSAD